MTAVDARDLQTETFSNARGWMTVRVTHGPSAIAVERSRTETLRSAVQAQQECVKEIRQLLADRRWPEQSEPTAPAAPARATPPRARGSRSDVDRLVDRLAQLEARVAGLEAAISRSADGGHH